MKQYTFTELGYFTKSTIEKIAKAMNGKTMMKFNVKSSNFAGNHTLIIETDYDATEEEIKNFFIGAILEYL